MHEDARKAWRWPLLSLCHCEKPLKTGVFVSMWQSRDIRSQSRDTKTERWHGQTVYRPCSTGLTRFISCCAIKQQHMYILAYKWLPLLCVVSTRAPAILKIRHCCIWIFKDFIDCLRAGIPSSSHPHEPQWITIQFHFQLLRLYLNIAACDHDKFSHSSSNYTTNIKSTTLSSHKTFTFRVKI